MLNHFLNACSAIWSQDIGQLKALHSFFYSISGFAIFLENGLIPAAPFPCDSIVILSGTLARENIIDPLMIFFTIAGSAFFGSVFAYYQGKCITHLSFVQNWINKVPKEKMNSVDTLLKKYGFVALFFAKFIPVIRSLLPLIMGSRKLHFCDFVLPAIISASIWAFLLIGLGYLIPSLSPPLQYFCMKALIIVPVVFLLISICIFLFGYMKSKIRQ